MMSAVNMNKAQVRMEFLASIIRSLPSEEIFALLDQVFPGMGEEEKEDLHDMILASQDGEIDPADSLSADDFFSQLEG